MDGDRLAAVSCPNDIVRFVRESAIRGYLYPPDRDLQDTHMLGNDIANLAAL